MENYKLDDRAYIDRVSKLLLYRERGRLSKSLGLTFEGYLPGASIGSIVTISNSVGEATEAEVIGFKDRRVVLMPLEDGRGLSNNSKIILKEAEATVPVSELLLGRVLDGRGVPIDGKGPIEQGKKGVARRGIYGSPVNPLSRATIHDPLDLGIRAINGLLTCGKGQRMGIMAGSGVGKSVLLGMMARYTKAQVNVIALVGERGREVREFIERDLGPEGMKRSVVIVATSEKSPLLRMRCAFLAATISEYFCDKGLDVLMLMDSVTRFCMAQREIGLSMGEPPASKGYTPSVFATLPKLLERAGTRAKGSITGLYTVLVEGDDLEDPVADSARAILDGHIVLSRQLAARNHYPAIDVSMSVSRVMNEVISKDHRANAGELRDLMATYAQNEDLINIGAYVKGSNAKLDQAISIMERVKAYLRQGIEEKATLADSSAGINGILRAVKG